MSGFGVDGGSVGNFEKPHIQIQHEETNKDKDEGLKTVQLVNGNTAKFTNGNGENQEQEESTSMAGENVENPIKKLKTEPETEPEKEKQEKSNKLLKKGVILNLCLLLVNFALVGFVMHRTSEISCCCSNGQNDSAFVNQTDETGAGQILEEMKLELSGIKEWKNSTEETFESHRLQIQSLLNQTKLDEQFESLGKENVKLKKSHEELKEQFESLSQTFELLKSNISSTRPVSLVTPAPTQNKTETTPAPPPKIVTSCSVAMEMLPSPRSKKQTIYPHGNRTSLEVLCDFEVDGGGWTIIQKRTSGSAQEFSQTWSLSGNLWLGLENIRALTKNGDQELRIELEDFDGNKAWTKYSSFSIADASSLYSLSVSGFYANSTAGDSMTSSTNNYYNINGRRFHTEDNTEITVCDISRTGGWWFMDCSTQSNLNGNYGTTSDGVSQWKRMIWGSWKGYTHYLAKTDLRQNTTKTTFSSFSKNAIDGKSSTAHQSTLNTIS